MEKENVRMYLDIFKKYSIYKIGVINLQIEYFLDSKKRIFDILIDYQHYCSNNFF